MINNKTISNAYNEVPSNDEIEQTTVKRSLSPNNVRVLFITNFTNIRNL